MQWLKMANLGNLNLTHYLVSRDRIIDQRAIAAWSTLNYSLSIQP